MKQSDIFVLDKCEITVDKKNYTLNPMWIYTISESQKVLLVQFLSPTFHILEQRKERFRVRFLFINVKFI